MTNELVVTDLLGDGGDPISYSILDGTACAKGALMENIDNRYVVQCTAADKPIAGILTAEKVASDGVTSCSVYTNCIAKGVHSGPGITLGGQVTGTGAANQLKAIDTLDAETGDVLGYALETVADGETFHIRVQK